MVLWVKRVLNKKTKVDSTIKIECIFAFKETKKVVWIKKYIIELGMIISIVDLVALHCNNNGVIVQAKKSRSHQWLKNVLRQFHLLENHRKKKYKDRASTH
jgi:hypothetical protein